jgi:hypothetical protein
MISSLIVLPHFSFQHARFDWLLQNRLEKKLQQLNAFAKKMQICCEKRDSDMMAEGFKVFQLKQFYHKSKR